MREEVIAWLGADRAALIEQRRPGAIQSGINLVAGLPQQLQVGGAAIRALHAAGMAGTAEDNWLYANPGKTRADYPPTVKAAELAKAQAAEQTAAEAKAVADKAQADAALAESEVEHTHS